MLHAMDSGYAFVTLGDGILYEGALSTRGRGFEEQPG
jgi:hypothetical protein